MNKNKVYVPCPQCTDIFCECEQEERSSVNPEIPSIDEDFDEINLDNLHYEGRHGTENT